MILQAVLGGSCLFGRRVCVLKSSIHVSETVWTGDDARDVFDCAELLLMGVAIYLITQCKGSPPTYQRLFRAPFDNNVTTPMFRPIIKQCTEV